MSFRVVGFSQETYCVNPSPNNTNTSAALNFTATLIPTTSWKYWTTSTITTTGNINLTNNKLFSQTSVKLQSGFKATSTGNKIVVGVGSCSTPSARIVNESSKENDLRENEIGELNEIFVYPSPNNGSFTVNVGNLKSGIIRVEDMTGKLINEQVIESENTNQFQLSEASGMCLVRIITENQMIVKKIIIK
jgi:hypothetical protein